MLSDVDTPEPEDGPSLVLEDLSCHLSELLDSEPIGDDSLSPRHSTSLFIIYLFFLISFNYFFYFFFRKAFSVIKQLVF